MRRPKRRHAKRPVFTPGKKSVRGIVKSWTCLRTSDLRGNPTASELELDGLLRDSGYAGRYIFQAPLFGFWADFYFPSKRLIVELYGASHLGREQKDRRRDLVLHERGIRTLRIQAYRVFQDQRGVLKSISAALRKGGHR